ncbi:MAG: hypothetical protein MK135_00705 [Polyangiaceae bacterium]|nr:hypothetical protein [Polyangiaceae bacterium]
MKRTLFTSIALFFLPGCSLIGLTNFDLPECQDSAECNTAFGEGVDNYYEGCEAFACVEGACVDISGSEICDNRDNDCDGLIDETNDGVSPISVLRSDIPITANITSRVNVASGVDLNSLAFVRDNQISSIDLETSQTSSLALYANAQPATPNSSALAEGCYRPDSLPDATAPSNCNILQDFSFSAGQDVGFFATVLTSGCGGGEIHAGVIDPRQPNQLIDRGDATRNPSYQGVDPTNTSCTRSSRSACQAAIDDGDDAAVVLECGGSTPTIVANGNQGLLTYTARKTAPDLGCSEEIADVQSLMLFATSGTNVEKFWFSNPSGNGMVQSLGKTNAHAPAGMIAISSEESEFQAQGFIASFANENGEVQLSWVPQQAEPPTPEILSCPDPDCLTRGPGKDSPALAGIKELKVLDATDATVTQLAFLPTGESTGSLAISWLGGCESLSGFVQVLTLDLSGEEPEVIAEYPIQELGAVKGPVYLYPESQNFFQPGTSRNDRTFTDENAGGFWVSFKGDSGLSALRIAAADGRFVDPNESIPLTSSLADSINGVSAGSKTFYIRDNESKELQATQLSCD